MGEWSEYFEDFPEENPANWINGRYDPQAAPEARRKAEAFREREKLAREQAEVNAETRRIIDKHIRKNS